MKAVPLEFAHVAVEGPIGVGKGTFAAALAAATGARWLRDPGAGNPYLASFYRDPRANALHAQLHFLVSRIEALDDPLMRRPLAPVVTDFMLEKDRLFAELTLDETEWQLYAALYERLVPKLAVPDLVIYLQAPVERLIERIERRGIAHESRIDSTYLQRLSSSCERFFHEFTQCPLLIVNTGDIDLAGDAREVERLIERIRALDGGRHYFNPSAGRVA